MKNKAEILDKKEFYISGLCERCFDAIMKI